MALRILPRWSRKDTFSYSLTFGPLSFGGLLIVTRAGGRVVPGECAVVLRPDAGPANDVSSHGLSAVRIHPFLVVVEEFRDPGFEPCVAAP